MDNDQLPPPLPPLETTEVRPKLGAWDKLKQDMAKVKLEHNARMAPVRAATDARKAEAAEKEAARLAKEDAEPVRCPGKGWPRKCGSTQLQVGEQKFGIGKAVVGGVLLGGIGLLAGGIGRGNVVITCLKCGHRWTPGR